MPLSYFGFFFQPFPRVFFMFSHLTGFSLSYVFGNNFVHFIKYSNNYQLSLILHWEELMLKANVWLA